MRNLDESTEPINNSVDNRTRAVIVERIVESGELIEDVAKSLRLNQKSVSSIVRIYNQSWRINRLMRRGSPTKKITLVISEFIENLVEFIQP
jgi:hypothetical protein